VAPAPKAIEARRLLVGDVEFAVIEWPTGTQTLPPMLTRAEREVVALVLVGLSNREIARQRGSTTRTVARRNGAWFELIFGDEIRNRRAHPDLFDAGGEAFEVLLGLVDECQASSVIDPGLSRVDVAASLWTHIHGLCGLSRHWPTSGRIATARSARKLVETHMSLLLVGLGGGRG
jgi:hypothetical protein